MRRSKKSLLFVHVEVLHALAVSSPNCPGCGAPPAEQEVRNYDSTWHDGDVHCTKCGGYVRMYDAG